MYMRVTAARYDPIREEEVNRLIQEHLLPTYRRTPGFQRYGGGVDRAGKRLVEVTYWDSAAHAAAATEAARSALAQLHAAGVTIETTEVVEVIAQL